MGGVRRLLAAVEYLNLPHRIVTPATWNRALGIPAGLKGRAKKEASFALCRRLWGPAFDAMKIGISKDGQHEALLIAREDRRHHGRAGDRSSQPSSGTGVNQDRVDGEGG